MYRRILVPLDGSKRAEAILPHVESLAACYSATVYLLQVLEPNPVIVDPYDPLPPLPTVDDIEQQTRHIDTYLATVGARLRAEEIVTERRVVRGPVVESIIAVADDLDADLIAMASHGRSGLSRVFYGSVAAGVLQRIDRPLLLIRAQGE